MPGLFERALIEGVLLIIVIVCSLLAFMAIRKARRGQAPPPEVALPSNEEQLAHFDELLQQREADLRQRQQREAGER